MKHTIALFTAVAFVVLLASCAGKSMGTHFSDPSVLSGTWNSNSTTLNSRGHNTTQKTLVLKFNEDGSITGTAQWTLETGPGGNSLEIQTDSDKEHLIGSFNQHDGVFFLIETEENGFWHCRAIDNDLLHCHLIQTGSKHVSTFAAFTRDLD
jgi:hypothetical protein